MYVEKEWQVYYREYQERIVAIQAVLAQNPGTAAIFQAAGYYLIMWTNKLLLRGDICDTDKLPVPLNPYRLRTISNIQPDQYPNLWAENGDKEIMDMWLKKPVLQAMPQMVIDGLTNTFGPLVVTW